MNKKEQVLRELLQAVCDECSYDGYPITPDMIIAKRGTINVIMTRCLFVTAAMFMNYTKSSLAILLERSEQAIDDILDTAYTFRASKNWTYILAEGECNKRAKAIKDKYMEG